MPEDGPWETVGGWVMSELGRLPVVGDVVESAAGTFRVERLDGRRIDRIRFTPTPEDEVVEQPERGGRAERAGRTERTGRSDAPASMRDVDARQRESAR